MATQFPQSAAFETLVERLLAAPEICADLTPLFRDEDLAQALARQAARWGLVLSAADLQARIGRVVPWPQAPPAGWLPIALRPQDDAVDWAFFGARRLRESFFAESVAPVRFTPLNRLLRLRTPLSAVEGLEGPAPDGLIFHMSRCGSTLVGRMLGAPAGSTILSEAAPIDAVVRSGLPHARRVSLLRGVVAALGRARGAGDARLFLKLDCWHAMDFGLFRQAFPKTPWLYLHRRPDEVLVSHARAAGMQMAPDVVSPAVFGLAMPTAPDAAYRAAVLAAIGEAMLAAFEADPRGLFVDYDSLPAAVGERVLPHFGWTPDPVEAEAMAAAALIDAKAPERRFTPDGADKRAAVDQAIRSVCAGPLESLHRLMREKGVEGARLGLGG